MMARQALVPASIVLAAACLQAAQPAPAAFDGKRAFEHVRQMVALGPRPAGSPALQKTRAYIAKELAAIGLKAEEQAFEPDTPLGRIKMVNLRATIPGQGPGRLVVAGHYDTKIFREFPFVGANDGGSSAAFLIELARALKARASGMTIELLFLDGEEATGEWTGTDHTYGSRYYVQAGQKDGTLKSLRALILVDMIGDARLGLRRDSKSTRWINDTIWAAARRINRPEFLDGPFDIEDDHVEFLEAGVQAVDLIDFEYPDQTMRYWHTKDDTLDHVAASSLQAVGDVLLAALPDIEKRLASQR